MQTLRGKKNKIVLSVLNVSNESGREESVTSLTFVPQKKDIIWSKKKKKNQATQVYWLKYSIAFILLSVMRERTKESM